MKPKDVEVEDHADRIDTICTYIDLLPGNHNILTDMEKKSLLFNSFPKTWRLEFTLNWNNPELASEKEIKDFMEKKKEMADKEYNNKEKAKVKAKKIEDSKKKRQERKGNQPCQTHNGMHLWKDCQSNPKNQGQGGGNFIRNIRRGGFSNFNSNLNSNFNGRGRGCLGRGFQGKGFARGRGNPQEQYYVNHYKDHSDIITIATTSSNTTPQDWDSHANESYHYDIHQQGGYNYPY